MLLVLGAASACTASAPATSAPTLAAARTLLGRHAAAVLHHDAKAYLADVSDAPAAGAFRARERLDITDLAHVPLASWSYADARLVEDPNALSAARARYQAPVVIVHVSLRYALRYVDPLPSSHELFLTVLNQGGHAVLAGDDDLTKQGSASWAGPWRYGPLVAVRGSTCLVLGPPGVPLQRIADEVDADVPAVTAVWGSDWQHDVAVLATGSAAAFSAAVGTSERLQDVSAAAVTDGVDPVSHRAYGQRLVLAPGASAALSSAGLRIVLRHELTHLATATTTQPSTPRWVVEGFAEYVANLGSGQPVGEAAAELRAAVRAGSVPSDLPSDTAFAATGSTLARAYEGAWLACQLIAAHAGTAGLLRFYRTAAAALLPAAQALAEALQQSVRLSLAAFTAQWRAYLVSELR